jgi:hypothetical protein
MDASEQIRLAYDALERCVDFKDKKILEIGGNSNCESAFPFLQAGAAHIILSGLDDIVAAPPAEIINANIEIVHADARDLTSTFECDQFDIVYGISAIEHISGAGWWGFPGFPKSCSPRQ